LPSRFEPREFWVAILAAVFGAGAALVLDEFAMLLHLDDVYWTTEGRLSIDACVAAIAFLGLAVLATFPLSSDSAGERLGRSIADGLIVLNICLVAVTLLKGKLKLGAIRHRLLATLARRKPSPRQTDLGPGPVSSIPTTGEGSDEARSATQLGRHAGSGAGSVFYDLIGGTPHLGSKRDN
jgi:hypothetical protein